MDQEKYRELTKEEIAAMPFWKRACFEWMPWNHSFDPQSVGDWEETFQVFGVHQQISDFIRKLDEIQRGE